MCVGMGGGGARVEKRERLSKKRKKKKPQTNKQQNTEAGHPPKHQDIRVHIGRREIGTEREKWGEGERGRG